MRYAVAGDVHFNEVDDEVVILDPRSDGYLALNGTAAAIWRAVAEGLDTPAVAQRLTTRFQVSSGRATADVAEFTGVLLARGLIAPVESAAPRDDGGTTG